MKVKIKKKKEAEEDEDEEKEDEEKENEERLQHQPHLQKKEEVRSGNNKRREIIEEDENIERRLKVNG